MATDLEALIRQREAEAQAEQAKNREARRAEADRQQRYHALAQNFHRNVTVWVTHAANEFSIKLRASAKITCDANKTACWITYRKRAGAGTVAEADLKFSIQENNTVTWSSSTGTPQGSAPYAEFTQQAVSAIMEQFLVAVLAA